MSQSLSQRPPYRPKRHKTTADGVEPSFAGPDLRTLECPKCELAYKALAEDQ